jgi:hypothetical protein
MARRFLRLVALVPLLGVLLLPGSVTASPGPSTFNGQGMSVMIPAEAQLISMTATVPFRLRCDPIPNAAFFGVGGTAHLGVTQTNGTKTNVAAGDIFVFVNTFSAAAQKARIKPLLQTGGGPTGGFQFPIVCDGSTWNPLTFLVTPDFATNQLTGPLRTGDVTADLTAQLCTFGYGGGTCDSIDTGHFGIRLTKNSVPPGGGTSFSGHGMQVSFPHAASLQGLTVSVTMQVVCNPVPSTFAPGGNGHLTLQQTRSGRVAAGAADIFWSTSGVPPGPGGGGPPTQLITCDGSTVNSYSIVVTPDFFFDPFTQALQRGSATTEFAAQICGFAYTGGVCDSIDTGPFSLRIGR